jgi:hypothetical protein
VLARDAMGDLVFRNLSVTEATQLYGSRKRKAPTAPIRTPVPAHGIVSTVPTHYASDFVDNVKSGFVTQGLNKTSAYNLSDIFQDVSWPFPHASPSPSSPLQLLAGSLENSQSGTLNNLVPLAIQNADCPTEVLSITDVPDTTLGRRLPSNDRENINVSVFGLGEFKSSVLQDPQSSTIKR